MSGRTRRCLVRDDTGELAHLSRDLTGVPGRAAPLPGRRPGRGPRRSCVRPDPRAGRTRRTRRSPSAARAARVARRRPRRPKYHLPARVRSGWRRGRGGVTPPARSWRGSRAWRRRRFSSRQPGLLCDPPAGLCTYFHNGLVQHTNATQAGRGPSRSSTRCSAIRLASAATCRDRPEGQRLSQPARAMLPAEMAARRLGRAERRPTAPPPRRGPSPRTTCTGRSWRASPTRCARSSRSAPTCCLPNGDTLRGRASLLERLRVFRRRSELVHSRPQPVRGRAAAGLELKGDGAPPRAGKVGHRYPNREKRWRTSSSARPPSRRSTSAGGEVEIVFGLAQRLGSVPLSSGTATSTPPTATCWSRVA